MPWSCEDSVFFPWVDDMSLVRGIFEGGVWNCDCNPRKPAVHFQAKKGKPQNVGKWFYTCQEEMNSPKKCNFFIWEDAAKKREQAALQNNSRTEPSRTNTTPTRPQRAASPPPTYTTEAGPSGAVRKRNRAVVDADNENYGYDQEDAALGNELMAAAETPRKAARTESHTTPRRKLPWDTERNTGLPTPQTGSRTKDPFQTRFAQPGGSLLTPSRYHKEEEHEHQQTLTPSSSQTIDTPTPARFRDVGNGKPDDIVHDVVGLLHEEGVVLSTKAESSLKRLLERYARRAEGANKGREVARLQIKAKDAKITELTHKNNALQAEVEAEKATTTFRIWKRNNESEQDNESDG